MKAILNFAISVILAVPMLSVAQVTTPAAPPAAPGVAAPPDTAGRPNDNFYKRVSPVERNVTAYDYVGEADVFWQKRVWRVIDVEEKANLPFQYTHVDWLDVKPLIEIMLNAVKSGEITAWNEDNWKTKATFQEITKRGGAGYDTVPKYDKTTGEVIGDTVVYNEFDMSAVKKFRIKEDWFVDKESSTMQCRIVGIAPLFKDQKLGDIPMFWAYFPDLRKVLVKNDVFNPKNDAIRLSWDDLFESRMFSSYVIKESNVFDRRIQDYTNGIDALMESDRVKNEIFEKEHDMWSY